MSRKSTRTSWALPPQAAHSEFRPPACPPEPSGFKSQISNSLLFAGIKHRTRTPKCSPIASTFARPSVSWTAPATRSGDGAFARTCRRQINHHLRALNSGVALPPSLRYDAASRFPPQSKTLHPCGSHRSARQRLDCGVFSAALVRAPSCGAPSGCTYRVRLGFQVSGFKSQFYSWRLFAARRGYISQSRATHPALVAPKLGVGGSPPPTMKITKQTHFRNGVSTSKSDMYAISAAFASEKRTQFSPDISSPLSPAMGAKFRPVAGSVLFSYSAIRNPSSALRKSNLIQPNPTKTFLRPCPPSFNRHATPLLVPNSELRTPHPQSSALGSQTKSDQVRPLK